MATSSWNIPYEYHYACCTYCMGHPDAEVSPDTYSNISTQIDSINFPCPTFVGGNYGTVTEGNNRSCNVYGGMVVDSQRVFDL